MTATRYVIVATRARDRWFDLDAVRANGPNPNTHARTAKGVASRPNDCKTSPDGNRDTLAIQHASEQGAPPLDWYLDDGVMAPSKERHMLGQATFLLGDVRSQLHKLIAEQALFDLCVTSPPFYNLRSYVADDHPDKALEIGSEANPAEYLDTLLGLVALIDQVLAPHGSLVWELGDTYAGSGGAGGDYNPGGLREGQDKFDGTAYIARQDTKYPKVQRKGMAGGGITNLHGKVQGGGPGFPLDKSLCGFPTLFAWSLAYGRNLLTGEPSPAGQWRIRNIIPWARPNPPVGALGDKVRPATSYVTVACRARDRWFDLDAVRTATLEPDKPRGGGKGALNANPSQGWDANSTVASNNPAGAPPLDWYLDDRPEESCPTTTSTAWPNSTHAQTTAPSTHAQTTAPPAAGPTVTARPSVPGGLATDPWDDPTLPYGVDDGMWVIPTAPYKGAHYACVDDQTEALTPHGWKRHGELHDGDLIAAYDKASDHVSWRPAKFSRYQIDDEIIAIDKQQTSQWLTLEHRMLVRTRARPEPFVKLAGDITSGHDLMLTAPWAPIKATGPGEKMAELLGWYIAEGSAPKASRQAVIYQSESGNPSKVARIRQLLDALGADYRERRRERPAGIGFATSPSVEVAFFIRHSELADFLRANHKRLDPSFVFGWPEAEAAALLDGLIDGDGHRRIRDGRMMFTQKDKGTADMVQALALRLGYRAVVQQRREHDGGGWVVYIGTNRWVTLRGSDGWKAPIPRRRYVGTVWCPSVSSTFWLARRDGKPFITGNTWPPELVRRIVESMCPREVCRKCGKPRRRIVEDNDELAAAKALVGDKWQSGGMERGLKRPSGADRIDVSGHKITLGWTSCPCADYRPGIVLDPFVGSGTTMAVAVRHGRDAVGIDLDERNIALARARMGNLPLTVDGAEPAATWDEGSLFTSPAAEVRDERAL